LTNSDKKIQLWYTKRTELVRGPFPAGMISRHILLGRILQSDQISTDKVSWQLVSDVPELTPDIMIAMHSSSENEEKFKIAFLREDERRSGDRRGVNRIKDAGPIKSLIERRVVENESIVRHREIKTAFSDAIKKQDIIIKPRVIVLAAVMMVVIILSIYISPNVSNDELTAKCLSTPTPNVDWNYCGKEGVNLAGVSLAGAKLHSVRFGGANLNETNLIAADMSYANFANAYAASAKLQRSTLVGAVLRNADFSGADFSNADLRFAILNGTDLSNANLSGANLTHVVLNDAILTNVNFEDAILDKVIWNDNTLCAPESVGRCIPVKKK